MDMLNNKTETSNDKIESLNDKIESLNDKIESSNDKIESLNNTLTINFTNGILHLLAVNNENNKEYEISIGQTILKRLRNEKNCLYNELEQLYEDLKHFKMKKNPNLQVVWHSSSGMSVYIRGRKDSFAKYRCKCNCKCICGDKPSKDEPTNDKPTNDNPTEDILCHYCEAHKTITLCHIVLTEKSV